MVDRQRLIFEEEGFSEGFSEPKYTGSSLNFEQILKHREENDKKAEEQWQKNFYHGAPKEILRDY